MLRFRGHRLTATLLAAVWLYAAGLPLFSAPHFEADDIACGDTGWPGSSASQKFAQAVGVQGGGHCAVCHLQRAVRHAIVLAPTAIRDLGQTTSTPAAVPTAVSAQLVQHSSSRAPPSA